MSTDFRSLCAELLRAWQFGDDIAGPMNRARAELAKPEPEGPDHAEICRWLSGQAHWGPHDPNISRVANLVQYALARYGTPTTQPEPVAPTDEDLPMPAAIRDMPEQQQRWYALGWRAALARYARPTTQPVPVSERPWEREGWCDAEGQCWLRRKHEEDGVTWRLMAPASVFDDAMPTYYAEALPHHALPTPEATNA